MFFFSVRQVNDRVVVGNGSDSDHFRVCATSLKLLNFANGHNQNNETMHGIDGTYRIFVERYTLVPFGRSDMARHFHPIAFMITSHKCAEDYEYFYRSIVFWIEDTVAIFYPLTDYSLQI